MSKGVWKYEHIALDRVVDGDTVHLVVDLGFCLTRTSQPYRLARIDAPEIDTAAGLTSKGKLAAYLAGKALKMDSFGPDKYGRWLIELYVQEEPAWRSANQWLLDNHLAAVMK